MKSYKGAVFFDFDGTLVDEREKIYQPTETTLKSIDLLHKNGFMVGLATGRAKCYVPKTKIDFDCYVTSNGSYAEVDEKIVFNDLLSYEELTTLVKYFTSQNMGYMTENQEICYYSKFGREKFIEMMNLFNINMDCFYQMPKLDKVIANKMMFTCSDDEEKSFELLKKTFSDKYTITKHRSNPSGDLVKNYISKAAGIEKVISEFGLEIKDTYAFGDGENDFEMLSTVGHGITMGRHAEVLNEITEFVTDTVINEGITKGLKKYGLI